MTYLSPAKINLFLHITSKRDDGYHNLQTIFQLLDFYDEIDFSLRDDGKINRISGNEDILISNDLMIKSAKKLKQYRIETRNFFWPLHQQPILKKMGFFKNTKLPVAEYLSRNGLYLPSGLSITYLQQKFVIDKIKKIVSKLNI